ncbi:hypothetical protein Anapl_14116 [Anas platyrhynchos]|uniref:Uncharacterized protein n=1 Tax=Anas platyrhynchos TaxID=8839 RepID=R0LI15_ANAPL|nr:hypothetical protein Anapl_14116 [Anas platyrhynchos]
MKVSSAYGPCGLIFKTIQKVQTHRKADPVTGRLLQHQRPGQTDTWGHTSHKELTRSPECAAIVQVTDSCVKTTDAGKEACNPTINLSHHVVEHRSQVSSPSNTTYLKPSLTGGPANDC